MLEVLPFGSLMKYFARSLETLASSSNGTNQDRNLVPRNQMSSNHEPTSFILCMKEMFTLYRKSLANI